ncbi:SDR family NAD(P)-dependent oxidoreductase [Pseudohoeflea coraliihabitans]|uniref:SDR family NAD(P)-dependent oxidoreductase n=1 Tax=Pseudohoeflea coraliihabitans TaxID=2860393 RepID=A0ABS6WQM6_9HYPH|nr:SDR family NAD(P)-dependent oxidoreductase [Pseudohoeflea sp. DP4N28-3]MBW3097953.1 SDR family NAD(P)-dependent oxidoreductase [Pseudohoeflea sp. DP4N28-3]
MKKALIVGASRGIGAALAQDLTDRGESVIALSRSADGLDVTDEQSVKASLARLDGTFDTIIVATGALSAEDHAPEKTLKMLDPAATAAQFAVNATGPMLVLKHALRLLPRDRRSVFAALSARVGSIGDNRLGGWYSYRASKAALNQLVHTAAIEIARSHSQAICVALHPGTVATAFTENYRDRDKVTPKHAAANLLAVIDGLSAADTGGFFDWAGKSIKW